MGKPRPCPARRAGRPRKGPEGSGPSYARGASRVRARQGPH
ncbi:hypothetical protein HMPREF0682_0190, partial [Propionibacterium acidifaciens F0233]